ncbi:MAG: flavin reductase family protein [Reichenbachiella sp.]
MKEEAKFITIDPEITPLRDIYSLMVGGISPRPIALVSTISKKGINNLAPFSYFNAFGSNPPYVAFSPALSGRDGSPKDTLINVENHPECVIHAVSHSMVEQTSLASTMYDADVDEFAKSGFTPVDSDLVQPKRVKESPFQMECKVEQIVPLGGDKGSGNLVLCRVLKFHVNENCLDGELIDPHKLDLVGRNGANNYTRASGASIFELIKPRGIGIGMDSLPDHILRSNILSASNLAQLGNLTQIPDEAEINAFIDSLSTLESESTEYGRMAHEAYIHRESQESDTLEKFELSAKIALQHRDAEFAIRALMTMPVL